MFYYVTITRCGQKYYVVSPKWGEFKLSTIKEKNTYLWTSEESARADTRWEHLVQSGDGVEIKRTYFH